MRHRLVGRGECSVECGGIRARELAAQGIDTGLGLRQRGLCGFPGGLGFGIALLCLGDRGFG